MRPLLILIALVAATLAASQNLVPNGSFEAGATGWKLGDGVTVEKGAAADGDAFLRCGNVKPEVASSATSDPVTVKPKTGYIARARFRFEQGAHYTFGVLNPDGSFFASRDVYGCATDHWDQSVLPFRTEQQTSLTVYVARRYGASAVLFDDVQLVEDDTVKVGDVSPRPNPFPETTAAERQRGYLLSPQPWLRLMYPTYYPLRAEIGRPLECQLAPGEYEPATFAITSLRSLDNVQVTLKGDLQGERGQRLPAASINVGVVSLMKRYVTNSAPLKPGQCYERRPLLIYPNQPFEVPSRETRQVWLTVQAPADQPAGLYRGEIAISADGAGSATIPLRVRVLPLKLAEATPTYGMYHRREAQPKGYETEEFFRRCMADLRAHGMNSMSIYIHPERKRADGTWEIDLERDSDRWSLARQMQLLQETGMAPPGHPQLLLAADCTGTFFNGEKTIAEVERLRRERNWPELLYYLVDEPSSAAQYDMAKGLNNVVHRVPGVRTTTALGHPGELADYYDVWIVTTSSREIDGIIRLAQEKKKELWTYNCQWNGTQPANDRFYTGYHMWTTGMSGNWQWCYTEGIKGSSRLTDEVKWSLPYYEEPWYVNYVLPTPEGNLPTLGWEGRREGIDDYRYLQTLQEAIAGASPQQRKLAAEAEKFLAQVSKRTTAPDQPLPATNTGRNYGYVMHPGLQPQDYDQIRRQAADYIIKLQGR